MHKKLHIFDGVYENERRFIVTYLISWICFYILMIPFMSVTILNKNYKNSFSFTCGLIYILWNFGSLTTPKILVITFRTYNRILLKIGMFMHFIALVYLTQVILLVSSLKKSNILITFVVGGVINVVVFLPANIIQLIRLKKLRKTQQEKLSKILIDSDIGLQLSTYEYEQIFPPIPTVIPSTNTELRPIKEIQKMFTKTEYVIYMSIECTTILVSVLMSASVIFALYTQKYYIHVISLYWIINISALFGPTMLNWTSQKDHFGNTQNIQIITLCSVFTACMFVVIGSIYIKNTNVRKHFSMAGTLNGFVYITMLFIEYGISLFKT